MNYCRQTIAEQANVFLTKPGDDVAASPLPEFRTWREMRTQEGTKTHLLPVKIVCLFFNPQRLATDFHSCCCVRPSVSAASEARKQPST